MAPVRYCAPCEVSSTEERCFLCGAATEPSRPSAFKGTEESHYRDREAS